MAWVMPGDGAVRLTVRATVTVSADALVAALYACFSSPPDTLDDKTAGALAAAGLVFTGLEGLFRRAAQIAAAEQAGTVANSGWLATCRQYVSRMLAGGQGGSAGTELVS
jgi:hypothetical protein